MVHNCCTRHKMRKQKSVEGAPGRMSESESYDTGEPSPPQFHTVDVNVIHSCNLQCETVGNLCVCVEICPHSHLLIK